MEIVENQSPLIVAKSVFQKKQAALFSMMAAILITLLAGVFFSPLIGGLTVGVGYLFYSKPTVSLSIILVVPLICAMLMFYIISRFLYRSLKKANQYAVFQFYSDKMVLPATYRKKVLPYCDIESIEYSALQASGGGEPLGNLTIRIKNRSRLLHIMNIENGEQIYRTIQNAIDL